MEARDEPKLDSVGLDGAQAGGILGGNLKLHVVLQQRSLRLEQGVPRREATGVGPGEDREELFNIASWLKTKDRVMYLILKLKTASTLK